MKQRLQKMLSEAGLASRRKAEVMIAEGRVKLNGLTAKLGDSADWDEDIIEADGKRVEPAAEKLYYMLNKPRGYITSAEDDRGRKTVMQLLPGVKGRVYPVGRLDVASEGLLLFTNDGELARKITHPSSGIHKRYYVSVKGNITEAVPKLSQLTGIDGEPISPSVVDSVRRNDGGGSFFITISEGKNRQIRRMCEAVGLKVRRLKRVSVGNIELDGLPAGKYRPLSNEEVEYLKTL